jgi:hypothetical protein
VKELLRFHHIQHTFCHGRNWQTFVRSYIARRQLATMDHDPLRSPAPESRVFGDREMDSRRIHIGDPIHPQGGLVGKRDLLGALTRAHPQDRFPVLRQPIRWEVRNSIDAARDPFQFPSLREAGQNRIGDAEGTSLI